MRDSMLDASGESLPATSAQTADGAPFPHQVQLIRFYWLAWFLLMLAGIYFPEHGPIGRIVAPVGSLVMPLLGFAWVLGDARVHGVRLGRAFKLGVILASVLFVPVHLFRTRPARRVFRMVGVFFLKLFGIGFLAGLVAVALGAPALSAA